MRNKRVFQNIVLGFLTLLALCCVNGLVCAEDGSKPAPSSDKVDLVLVLDSSGSMLLTDPNRLRDEGTKLLLRSLHEGDRIGVIDFADGAKIVKPLTDFTKDTEGLLENAVSNISSTGEYTDLHSGIQAAQNMLQEGGREEARKVIVLLSDGKMEPNPAKGNPDALTNTLLNDNLPELKAKEIKVYTLYFSERADQELLSQIAAATDGVNWYTPNADKVHESFAELFLAVKKPQIVPMTSKGLKIDDEIDEATFYLNKDEGTEIAVISPDGTKITESSKPENVRWFRGQKFEVVTVENPEVGLWQLAGVSANDGYATVITNLKLVTQWPSSVTAEEPVTLQARFFDAEKPIVLPEMSGIIKYAFQIVPTDKVSEPVVREFLVDDGTKGDKVERDGVFSSAVTIKEPGEYKLTIIAQSPTFERTQQIPFRVKPRFISLRVEAAEEEHGAEQEHADEHGHEEAATEKEAEHGHEEAAHEEHGKPPANGHGEEKDGKEKTAGAQTVKAKAASFHIELSPEALDMKNIEVKLVAVDAQRSKYSFTPSKSHESPLVYEATSRFLPKAGSYTLQATVTGQSKSKQKIKEESEERTFVKLPSEAGADHEVVVITHESEETEVHEATPTSGGSGWILYLLLTLVLNGAAGAAALVMTKKLGSAKISLPPVPDSAPIQELLKNLQAKANIADVNLEDDLFTRGGAPGGEEQAPAVAAEAESAEAAPPPAEEAPAGEGSAQEEG